MKTREELNAIVAELSNNGEIPGTPKDILVAKIAREQAVFARFMDEQHNEDEIQIALKPVKSAIADYNDLMRVERLEAMTDMKPKEAVLSYLDNECVSGYVVAKGKESKKWEVQPSDEIMLEASDFVPVIFETELATIYDAVSIFCDNVIKVRFKDEQANIIRNAELHPGYVALRKSHGWEIDPKKAGYNKLAEQMTEICKMISVDMAPSMRSIDVKFVEYGLIVSKIAGNKNGFFQLKDRSTAIRLIWKAMYTRHNKAAYDFNTPADMSSAPQTAKANKAMAESGQSEEFHTLPKPEAGKVTVSEATPAPAKGEVSKKFNAKERVEAARAKKAAEAAAAEMAKK